MSYMVKQRTYKVVKLRLSCPPTFHQKKDNEFVESHPDLDGKYIVIYTRGRKNKFLYDTNDGLGYETEKEANAKKKQINLNRQRQIDEKKMLEEEKRRLEDERCEVVKAQILEKMEMTESEFFHYLYSLAQLNDPDDGYEGLNVEDVLGLIEELTEDEKKFISKWEYQYNQRQMDKMDELTGIKS